MSDPVYAADVLRVAWPALTNAEITVDELRNACGWDGDGDPPTVVILPDGRLAVTSFGIEPVRLIVPVTVDGPDE